MKMNGNHNIFWLQFCLWRGGITRWLGISLRYYITTSTSNSPIHCRHVRHVQRSTYCSKFSTSAPRHMVCIWSWWNHSFQSVASGFSTSAPRHMFCIWSWWNHSFQSVASLTPVNPYHAKLIRYVFDFHKLNNLIDQFDWSEFLSCINIHVDTKDRT